MNSDNIDCLLRKSTADGVGYLGVYARDRIPKHLSRYPSYYVANTDIASEPGTHWVAFYHHSPLRCEFFDSYARKPHYYGFTQFPNVLCSPAQIQSDFSNVCGHHCIAYLISRTRNKRKSTPNSIQSYVTRLLEKYRTSESIDEHVSDVIEKLARLKCIDCRMRCPKGAQCCRPKSSHLLH